MDRVLVTGATGFVGAMTVQVLRTAGHDVRATWHRRRPPAMNGVEWRQLELAGDGDASLCDDVDTVLHLAARAHVRGVGRWFGAPFRRVNADGTARLAALARRAGVRRFVYLGTIGVHGSENTVIDGVPRPFCADDPFHPADAYARSKAEGEVALTAAAAGGMESVVLRAPLVFGAGVGGNFLRLLRHLDRRLPLPVGPQPAPRSLVYVENLAAALAACVKSPGVANGAFLLGDSDLTVTDLAQRLATLLGRSLRTVRVPDCLLRGRALRSLTMPLLVDGAPFRAATGWQPALGLDVALARTVHGYRAER